MSPYDSLHFRPSGLLDSSATSADTAESRKFILDSQVKRIEPILEKLDAGRKSIGADRNLTQQGKVDALTKLEAELQGVFNKYGPENPTLEHELAGEIASLPKPATPSEMMTIHLQQQFLQDNTSDLARFAALLDRADKANNANKSAEDNQDNDVVLGAMLRDPLRRILTDAHRETVMNAYRTAKDPEKVKKIGQMQVVKQFYAANHTVAARKLNFKQPPKFL